MDLITVLDYSGEHLKGLYLLSGKTSYRQIVWSLEDARLGVIMILSLWNSASAEVPVKFQSDWKSLIPNLVARDFTKSCGKTSVRLVNKRPGGKMSYRTLNRCIVTHREHITFIHIYMYHLFRRTWKHNTRVTKYSVDYIESGLILPKELTKDSSSMRKKFILRL